MSTQDGGVPVVATDVQGGQTSTKVTLPGFTVTVSVTHSDDAGRTLDQRRINQYLENKVGEDDVDVATCKNLVCEIFVALDAEMVKVTITSIKKDLTISFFQKKEHARQKRKREKAEEEEE
jgi:ribonuclease I